MLDNRLISIKMGFFATKIVIEVFEFKTYITDFFEYKFSFFFSRMLLFKTSIKALNIF